MAYTTAQLKRKIFFNYPGGSIRCSLGLLSAIWKEGSLPSSCTPKEIPIAAYTYTRTQEIGGDAKTVNVNGYTRKNYPSTPANQASGGTRINISADGKYWVAWVSGTLTNFIEFLCTDLAALKGPVVFKSQVGANYGPYMPPAE